MANYMLLIASISMFWTNVVGVASLNPWMLYCSCLEEGHIYCLENVYFNPATYNKCNFNGTNQKIKMTLKSIGSFSNIMITEIQDQVVELYFKENDDLYIIPTEFFLMKNIERLTVCESHMRTAPFDDIVNLKNLTYLDLSQNKIESCENSINSTQLSLKTLNFSHNIFTEIEDNMFIQFPELTWVSLAYNNITTISDYAFRSLGKLNYLDLSYNKIVTLNDILKPLTQLEEIYLDHNNLKILNKISFKSNPLKVLTISQNSIDNINNKPFDLLTNVNYINISYNNIESIETQVISECKNLIRFDISFNKIKFIEINNFKNNQLNEFIIEGNKLEIALQKGIFNGLTHVKQINLGSQNIGSIENFAFYGAPSIEHLNLSNNNIELVSYDSFKYLTKLKVLDLSNNLLYSANINMEDQKGLQWLSLKNNKIRNINNEVFINVTNLSYLDISNNHIATIDMSSFLNLPFLKDLLLNNNSLDLNNIKDIIKGLLNLEYIDISYNFIAVLKNNTFEDTTHLKYINVSGCNISKLEYNVFAGVSELELLDLSFNLITHLAINPNHISKLTKVLLNNNQLNTINEKIFLSNELTYVKLSFNLQSEVYFNYSIFNHSHLSFLELNGIKGINLLDSHNIFIKRIRIYDSEINDITRLKIGPDSINYIELTSSHITSIDKNLFANYFQLSSLDVSNNNINYIQPGSFINNKELRELNISHNEIYALDFGVFDGLTNMKSLDLTFNLLEKVLLYPIIKPTYGSLNVIYFDYNLIKSIDFSHLVFIPTLISLGNNEIPCKVLLGYHGFQLTALNMDYHTENVRGISCIGNSEEQKSQTGSNSDILSDLTPALNRLSENVKNLTMEMRGHIVLDYDQSNQDNSSFNISSQNPISGHKTKYHSISQYYESMRAENINLQTNINGIHEVSDKLSAAVIFLNIVLGLILLTSLVFLAAKYINFNHMCYRFRSMRYSEVIDSVELET